MLKKAIILFVMILPAGCETQQQSESEFDRVSREIEQMKTKALAQPGPNITVVVNMLSVNERDYSAIAGLLRYVSTNYAVAARPDIMTNSGLKVGIADQNFQAQLRLAKQNIKSVSENELFLTVTENVPGYIDIGTEIAVARFYYLGRWYSGVEYDFRRAARALKVTAYKRPDGRLNMQLTPVFSRFLDSSGSLELTELSTRVTAKSGQTIVIGSVNTNDTSVASALLSSSRLNQSRQTLITVTPYYK